MIQAVTGMVDWKKQFMEASGVAAFKPLSPDFTGIFSKNKSRLSRVVKIV